MRLEIPGRRETNEEVHEEGGWCERGGSTFPVATSTEQPKREAKTGIWKNSTEKILKNDLRFDFSYLINNNIIDLLLYIFQ